eukprot:5873206-Amphidinium_carterae.1
MASGSRRGIHHCVWICVVADEAALVDDSSPCSSSPSSACPCTRERAHAAHHAAESFEAMRSVLHAP